MSVITALTTGFETLNRRLWLVLFPVGLNLVLWCGPQISIAPLVRRIATLWLLSPAASAYNQTQIVAWRQRLEELARSINLFDALAVVTPNTDVLSRLLVYPFTNILTMPLLAVSPDPRTAPAPLRLPAIELHEWATLFVTATVLWLAGVFLSALFLGLIARIVRDDELEPAALFKQVGASGVRIASYLLLGSFGAALLMLPLLLRPDPHPPTLTVWLAFILWLGAGFYLFFTPAALVINEVHPLRAAWYSIQVVRMDPWSALGLIGSMTMLHTGLPLLWQQLTTWPMGLLIAITGQAYVGTGLIVACMMFYLDRYRQWRELVMAAGPR